MIMKGGKYLMKEAKMCLPVALRKKVNFHILVNNKIIKVK